MEDADQDDAVASENTAPFSCRHRFQVNFEQLQERDTEIQRLKQENQEQNVALKGNNLLLYKMREELIRAEERQHEAEAELLLRHCLEDSDDDNGAAVEETQHQNASRLREMEHEVDWMREVAETLSIELQESQDARVQEKIHMERALKEANDQAGEKENRALRAELSSLQDVLEELDKKFSEMEEQDCIEALALEKEMTRRDAEVQELKEQLIGQAERVHELEEQLKATVTTNQELRAQFDVERNELLRQLAEREELKTQMSECKLENVRKALVKAKAEAAAWQKRWWDLTSVTLLQFERLQRSQEELKQCWTLDSEYPPGADISD